MDCQRQISLEQCILLTGVLLAAFLREQTAR
jgi:hypothetical protein